MKKTIKTILGVAFALSLATSAFAATSITIGETELKEIAGLTEGSTANLQLAGSPTLAYVDGKGLLISGRSADWNAIDVLFAGLDAGTYVMEADLSADTAVQFKIGEADSPYSELAKSDDGVTSVTLTVEFTVADDGGEMKANGQNRFRLQTTGTDDYYISEVRIKEKTAATEEKDTTNTTEGTTTKAQGDKAVPTGVEDVALITGLAVIATAGIIISRRK